MPTTRQIINKVAILLKRRGFIFEQAGEDVFSLIRPEWYYGHDTYFEMDLEYLAELLTNAHAGEVDGTGWFRLFDDADISYLCNLFKCTDERIGVGAGGEKQQWSSIQNPRRYGVPVKWLDPNIAYYVRALGMCGLKTNSCCDGNHYKSSRQKLYVAFDRPVYPVFHRWMWETIGIPYEIPWKWDDNGASVRITEENKKNIYNNIFAAAQFIYESRDLLIKLRQIAAQQIDEETANSIQEEELSSLFLKEVNNAYRLLLNT